MIDISEGSLVKKTLADQIYDILYKAIITGALKPEEELAERELSKKLNVSRTPIREAINRLKLEGLAEGNNYSKVVVKAISAEDIEEVFDLRSLVEVYAIEWTIVNCQENDLAQLESILEKSYQEIEAGNWHKVVEYNTEFHDGLARLSGKKRVIQLLATFRDISLRQRMYGLTNKDRALKIYRSHKRLLELIAAKDTAGAVAEIRKHLMESKQITLEGT